jgi:hypothetical protein
MEERKTTMKCNPLTRPFKPFNRVFLSGLLAILSLSGPSQAANKTQVWSDPGTATKEDPDFSIQGEYGSVKPVALVGVQVVARAQGKFDAYVLEGGLPGLGWTREKKRTVLKGTREGDTVTFGSANNTMSATIRDRQFLLTDNKNQAWS